MLITATEAKNKFGSICSAAKSEPVFVQKDGRVDTVIMSIHQFEELKTLDNALENKKKRQNLKKNMPIGSKR